MFTKTTAGQIGPTYIGYVYLSYCRASGKHYIGKRVGPYVQWYYGGGSICRKALKKYGRSEFEVYPIQFAKDIDELNQSEIDHIAIARFYGVELYNILSGGDDERRGSEIPDEIRKRMSAAQMGHSVSEECRNNISKANKGRIITPEWRRNISIATKGLKRSQTTKDRISAALSKRYETISHHATGAIRTQETCDKISAALKGRVITEEWRRKISETKLKKRLQNG